MNDYDLYGIKLGMNDNLMVSVDNLNLVWYVVPVVANNTFYIEIDYNETSCDFVYSVIVPISNENFFIYNCISYEGENVIGLFNVNDLFSFNLMNEQKLSNYSTQDNFIVNIDGESNGVYGFADDFIFYYKIDSTYELIVWSNTLNISPRSFDIGLNIDLGILVGYCQLTSTLAVECAFIIQLNQSLSCPIRLNEFSITNYIQFPYSDPRTNHHISSSRVYSSETLLSVSISWFSRRVLIGIPSLNIVLLYSIDNPSILLGRHDNGIGLMGFGKDVRWLNDKGEKAVIISNSYSYSSNQWISSLIHIYDIQSDGFNDKSEPILIYPNSEQILFPWLNPSLIRLVCSRSGHVTIFDILGNAGIIYSTPEGTYPNTNSNYYTSIIVPCIRGTFRNFNGIELCFSCPNGTYSSNCSECLLNNSFCPVGSIEDLSYSLIESIEQDEDDYPSSPENTVFDDVLMQNMFSLNTKSIHCIIVSPITWVILMIIIGISIAIGMTIHETYGPSKHRIRDWTKQMLKKVDLIGEGELWIGGLVSAAVIVLIISAYVFSNKYSSKYPIEENSGSSSFACDTTIRNAKFSTTVQKVPNTPRSNKDIQMMFDLLNSQVFTLNINLIQTAFSCNDSFIVERFVGSTISNLSISNCETNENESILRLSVPLPTHTINVQLSLFGLKTIGAISIGLTGPSAISIDNRYKLMKLNFSSSFIPLSLNKVLSSSTLFSIELTQIINRTAPLNSEDLSIYSGIWSSSFNVEMDQLFSQLTRYIYSKRTYTNISINIDQSVFYVNNVQEPIARQTEIIFHNLLFTIVVLEVFGLLFLIIKLLFIPIFQRIKYILNSNRVTPIKDNLDEIMVDKTNLVTIDKPRSHQRWSIMIVK